MLLIFYLINFFFVLRTTFAVNCISGTVYLKDDGKYELKQGVIDKINGVAIGFYSDYTKHQSGFGELQIWTNETYDDYIQSYAAGYLEGSLTHERTFEFFKNSKYGNGITEKEEKFFTKQHSWAKKKATAETNNIYWVHANNILSQLDGIQAGYRDYAKNSLPDWAFLVMNANGDYDDLQPALNPELRAKCDEMSKREIQKFFLTKSRCSVLVKLTPDFSDLIVGHTTWNDYTSMTRIYKHYHLNLKASVAKKMTFSSYPGVIASVDDFYMMDSGLAVVETTNNICSDDLYDQIQPHSLFSWQRVRLANAGATNGKQWYKLFKEYNSGTYNNQYMVIDYKKFKPKNALVKNTLWVIEQIPGLIMGQDQTSTLSKGYWSSYNQPFYEQVYNRSGFNTVDEKNNDTIGSMYAMDSRAKIFRRDHAKVVDMNTYREILRYNGYMNDPYSEGDPAESVCARTDLAKQGFKNYGCVDGKYTNSSMFSKLQSFAVNGPTAQNVPPFDWRTTRTKDSHIGQPDVFNFTFELFDPKWDVDAPENTWIQCRLPSMGNAIAIDEDATLE